MPGATGVGAHRGMGGMTVSRGGTRGHGSARGAQGCGVMAGEEHEGMAEVVGKHRGVRSKGRAWWQAGGGEERGGGRGREVESTTVSPLALMGR